MGNHRLEHHRTRINTISPRVSKAIVVETKKQPARIQVIQSLNAIIATTRVDTIVVPNMNVARRGVIGSVINLGHGLGKLSTGRNLNRSSELPTVNTIVVGTPQMVFTNPRMTIHVHQTTN